MASARVREGWDGRHSSYPAGFDGARRTKSTGGRSIHSGLEQLAELWLCPASYEWFRAWEDLSRKHRGVVRVLIPWPAGPGCPGRYGPLCVCTFRWPASSSASLWTVLASGGVALTLATLNLVDNAIKYAADGKRIVVRLRRDGARVVLEVKDFGPGIDAAEHDRIFERFYRARAVRLKPIRGSGIGLALVEHIAKAHGGGVWIDSKPGAGATFGLWIPVPDAETS